MRPQPARALSPSPYTPTPTVALSGTLAQIAPVPFLAEIDTKGKAIMYSVTNPHDHDLTVHHVFVSKDGERIIHSFSEVIPPRMTAPYRLLGLETMPADFDGFVRVYASEPLVLTDLGPDPDPTKTPEIKTVVTHADLEPAMVTPKSKRRLH